MGGCYSTRAELVADAYNLPSGISTPHKGSPLPLRKRSSMSAMRRVTPYSRCRQTSAPSSMSPDASVHVTSPAMNSTTPAAGPEYFCKPDGDQSRSCRSKPSNSKLPVVASGGGRGGATSAAQQRLRLVSTTLPAAERVSRRGATATPRAAVSMVGGSNPVAGATFRRASPHQHYRTSQRQQLRRTTDAAFALDGHQSRPDGDRFDTRQRAADDNCISLTESTSDEDHQQQQINSDGSIRVGIDAAGTSIALSVNIGGGGGGGMCCASQRARPQVTVSAGGRAVGDRTLLWSSRRAGAPESRLSDAHKRTAATRTATASSAAAAAAAISSLPYRRCATEGAVAGGSHAASLALLSARSVRSRVSLWEQKTLTGDGAADSGGGSPLLRWDTTGGRRTTPHIARLRQEVRQLTRDVATSPLRQMTRDICTCTEHEPSPAVGVMRPRGVNVSTLSSSPAVASGSGSGDASTVHFIDDEIGDQPELSGGGGAAAEETADTAPDIVASLGAIVTRAADDASPYAAGSGESPYVRPFRLTPRPLPAITTAAVLESSTPVSSVTRQISSLHIDSNHDNCDVSPAITTCSLHVMHNVSTSIVASGTSPTRNIDVVTCGGDGDVVFTPSEADGGVCSDAVSQLSTMSAVDTSADTDTDDCSLSSYGGGGGLSRHQSRTGGATSEHIVSSAPRTLKPPRQNSGGDGDWLLIDRVTYMYMAQDFTHVKTMLHKLRRILHTDSSPIPFDSSVHSPCRMGSVSSESPLSSLEFRPTDLAADNCQLRHQVAQLQHELDEKNRTIHLLQQQLAKYATAVDHVAPPSGVL